MQCTITHTGRSNHSIKGWSWTSSSSCTTPSDPQERLTYGSPRFPPVPSAQAVFVERVRDAIEANLGNANFGVDWLADELCLCPRQLQRRLRASLGVSAAYCIRLLRLQRAAQLLSQQAGTIAEVAYAVGFRDVRHFGRLFKRSVGVSPSAYAQRGKSPTLAHNASVLKPVISLSLVGNTNPIPRTS